MSGISLVFHKKVLLGRVDVTNLYASCADDCCEVIVWTAGIRNYAKAVIRNIDRQNVIAHCIYRHEKWFRPGDYTKDLAMLGRCGPSVMSGQGGQEVKERRFPVWWGSLHTAEENIQRKSLASATYLKHSG